MITFTFLRGAHTYDRVRTSHSLIAVSFQILDCQGTPDKEDVIRGEEGPSLTIHNKEYRGPCTPQGLLERGLEGSPVLSQGTGSDATCFLFGEDVASVAAACAFIMPLGQLTANDLHARKSNARRQQSRSSLGTLYAVPTEETT